MVTDTRHGFLGGGTPASANSEATGGTLRSELVVPAVRTESGYRQFKLCVRCNMPTNSVGLSSVCFFCFVFTLIQKFNILRLGPLSRQFPWRSPCGMTKKFPPRVRVS